MDITHPKGTTLTLDGVSVKEVPTPLAPAYEITRVSLTATASTGAHTLNASAPVGIQVMGYGLYTSYQYPGGANVKAVAAPPPLVLLH